MSPSRAVSITMFQTLVTINAQQNSFKKLLQGNVGHFQLVFPPYIFALGGFLQNQCKPCGGLLVSLCFLRISGY